MADLPQRTVTGPDVSQVPSVSGFLDKQFATEQAAVDPIVAAMQAREKPLDIYTKLEAEAGVPELRVTAKNIGSEINRLEDTLYGLEENIAGRTRESLVTEAMRGRMVAAEAEPMQKNLSRLTTGLGRIQGAISDAMQGINTKTSLALQGQEMDLEPLQFQFSTLVDRNTRALTGFTEDRQTALDQIYAKWERGNQVSDQEWQLAADIARTEAAYDREVRAAAAAAGVSDLSGGYLDVLARVGRTVSDQQSFDNKLKSYTTYKDSGSSSSTTTTYKPTSYTSSNSRYTATPSTTPSLTPASDLLSIWKAYQ